VTLHRTTALTVLGCVLLAGCSRGLPRSKAEPPPQITLTPIDDRGLDEAVARQRGKVVLVDFWAIWCVPCVKLFPHLAELQRRLADRDLAVISVSMDDVDSREAVLAFLRDRRAAPENFISRYGLGSEGFEAFDIGDGALPHLKLYDRDGRLQKTFSSGGGPLDPEAIDRAVEELVRR